ncbi:hypothetical protein RN49_01455 [Pantoea agglomerans]|nr:hypothetical protein RN49_01455 [Pantoea agglomerans]MBA5701611.1 hypothetical protein [Pantoea agglomerans]
MDANGDRYPIPLPLPLPLLSPSGFITTCRGNFLDASGSLIRRAGFTFSRHSRRKTARLRVDRCPAVDN